MPLNPTVLPTKHSEIALNLTPASHKVYGYGYSPERQVLAVQFKNPQTGEPGPIVYEYPEITPEMFAALEAADSKGSHINKYFVITRWAFERLLPVKPADPAPAAEA